MIREVDILLMGVDIFVPLILRDTRDILLRFVRDAQEESLVLPREDMFTIYKKIKEIRDLYTRITRKSTPSSNVELMTGKLDSIPPRPFLGAQ
jgi:hypothetical protein